MAAAEHTAVPFYHGSTQAMEQQGNYRLPFQRTRPSRKHRLGFLDEAVPIPSLELEPVADPAPVATRSGRVVSKPKHFTDFAATELATTGVPAS